MKSGNDKIIRNMRNMAWERAKGELRSMLHCFWDEYEQYERLSEEIDRFIQIVELNGLHE